MLLQQETLIAMAKVAMLLFVLTVKRAICSSADTLVVAV
jgi:hypothetical protein